MTVSIEPDSKYPGMYRLRINGTLTDMVNLSRAKDAAVKIENSGDYQPVARRHHAAINALERHQ